VRIALELKRDADPKMVMAYLYKHTPLQSTFPVNLTCLVPTENPAVSKPERLDLHEILWHFLDFRLHVVTRRLEFELTALTRRIHILEGFETIFDALDEILKIVRKSDGKQDAAEKIMKRFELDADQTDAILELKIYRLARLEILIIRNELDEKRKRARQIGSLLKDEEGRWKMVRSEIGEIHQKYGDARLDKRRTRIESDSGETEYTADDFIVEEDNVVIVSRDGWVKRQKEVRDLWWDIKPGDVVLDVGADFGSYTLTALACGAAQVYAWSPPFKNYPEAFECETLKKSAGLNLWAQRIRAYDYGLHQEQGWIAGFDGPRQSQLFPTEELARQAIQGKSGHCAVFFADTLDEWAHEISLDVADWLKIDTENCEEAILRGGEQVIKRFKPRIICEAHYHIDDECEDKITAYLATIGYRMAARRPHHSIAHCLYVPQ
jgi:FkbM family methyltransferase